MRIDIPAGEDNARAYVAANYAPELGAAGTHLARTAYAHSKLSLREYEAARRRTANINGCLRCIAWRTERDAVVGLAAIGVRPEDSIIGRGPAPEDDFYDSVDDWRTSPLFSDRERIAIEFAEKFALDPQGLAQDEDYWTRAHRLFSDAEIVDLAYCVAAWMGLGRISHILGLDAVCTITTLDSAQTQAA